MILLGDRDRDTICAISTPAGVGGISVIRVSGPLAISTVRKLAAFIPDKPIGHKCYFGVLKSPTSGNLIDEVLATIFLNGSSFTGEEVVEISCHGSPVISQTIIEELISVGCRLADKGEFTYRAFMHGKVDLVQAESIVALIESQSKKAAQVALAQLKGGVSDVVKSVEADIVWLLAHLEASIDFSVEDIEVVKDSVVIEKLGHIKHSLTSLVQSFKKGKKIVSGYSVAIVGEPNVGKSSLLNKILDEERAIVSPLAGTTRDIIQDHVIIDGVPVLFRDTAGIRETQDFVEKIGVDRSRGAIKEADLVFLVFDSSTNYFTGLFEMVDIKSKPVVVLANKADLLGNEEQRAMIKNGLFEALEKSNIFKDSELIQGFIDNNLLFSSALDKTIGQRIIKEVSDRLRPGDLGEGPMISQTRHFENLSQCLVSIDRALLLASSGASPEFTSIELKEALLRAQEVIGIRYDDQILDRIFKEFCIGK